MASSRVIALLSIALVAVACAAPLEEPAGQDSTPAPTTTTTTSATTTTTTTTTGSPSSTISPESSTQAKQTSTPANSSDFSAYTNTTFTCYGRSLGYYADVAQNCRVYHFCLLGEYNGEPIYQRVSYLCMNDKVFDQQALDCVKESELKAPCKDSPSYHDISNEVLRQAVLGSLASNGTDAAKPEDAHKSSSTTTRAP